MDSQSTESETVMNEMIVGKIGTIFGIELKCSRFPPGLWKAVVAEQQRLARLLDMNASPYKLVFRTFPSVWKSPSQEQSLGRLNRGMSPFTPWCDPDPFPSLMEAHARDLCIAMGIDPALLEDPVPEFSMGCDPEVVRTTEERQRLYSISRRPGKSSMAIQHRSEARTLTGTLLYGGIDPSRLLIVDPKPQHIPDWTDELRTFEGTFTVENEEELKNFMESLAPDPSFWQDDISKAIPYMMFGETWEEFHERIGYPLNEAQKEAYRNRVVVDSVPYKIPHYAAPKEVNRAPKSKCKKILRSKGKQAKSARKKQRG